MVDRDKGGSLDFTEFARAIRRGKITPSLIGDKDLRALFKAIDTDGGGSIDVEEFVDFVGEPVGPKGVEYSINPNPNR